MNISCWCAERICTMARSWGNFDASVDIVYIGGVEVGTIPRCVIDITAFYLACKRMRRVQSD
jgi:hypothetical protein